MFDLRNKNIWQKNIFFGPTLSFFDLEFFFILVTPPKQANIIRVFYGPKLIFFALTFYSIDQTFSKSGI